MCVCVCVCVYVCKEILTKRIGRSRVRYVTIDLYFFDEQSRKRNRCRWLVSHFLRKKSATTSIPFVPTYGNFRE